MLKKAKSIENGIRKAETILRTIGMGMLLLLMLLGAADVIGRYIFNRPILGTLEVSQILMGGAVVFGWAYTQAMRGNITVVLVVNRYPPRMRAILDFTTLFLALAFFSLMTWQSALETVFRWQRHELIQVIYIPTAPFLLLVSFGAFFLCLELIIQMVHVINQMKGGD